MKCMLIRKSFIYVSHDAHFHGAQLLSLHTIKALKENFHYSVAIISIGTGILIQDFQKYGPVYCLEENYPTEEKVELLIKKLLLKDYTIAICSTVISGDIVALLAKHNIKVISLIHELPHLIQQKLLSNENKHHLKVQQIINDKNSGSVFKQWIKGVSASIRANDC